MDSNIVNHFEIPYKDDETKQFFIDVFGWQVQEMPEMNYTMVRTVEVDEKMMPKEPGAINGGMYKTDDTSSNEPVIVITVANIDETVDKIKEAGGEVTREKSQVGDMGLYCQFKDSEGNILGLWENLKKE